MPNPLLEMNGLPPFSLIKPEHVEAAIDEMLARTRSALDVLLESQKELDYESLIVPIMRLWEDLSRVWSPVKHLNSVMNSDELRKAYNACVPKITEFYTEVGQNPVLYGHYKKIADAASFADLDPVQQQVVTKEVRDFHLTGVDLAEADQQRFKALAKELSGLSSSFQQNVLDATGAWTCLISDAKKLSGLPETVLALALQAAERKEQTGWLFTLDFPSYLAVMTHADDPDLRQDMYTAFATRASDQGPNAGEFDNSDIIAELLVKRKENAVLLGFSNYAERSLVKKMADTPDQVLAFLDDLALRAKPAAEKEFQALKNYAAEHYQVTELEPWDIAYYSEKLRQHKHAISQEELKPYFPAPKVIAGMFALVERLYGVQIKQRNDVDVWHKDVTFYEINDVSGKACGQFYLDSYARPNKRGGAWMDVCRTRQWTEDGELEVAVAYLVCNFSAPVGNDPALLSHDEVTTLFHEFGHGLHHMLSRVNQPAVSGIAGVEWDAVELPSQFMENFCWEREALDLMAAHYQTGEAIPDALFERMTAARNFQSAMQMMRQIEFSLFDMRLYMGEREGQKTQVMSLLADIRQEVSVVPAAEFGRFPHAFSHIFGGGYAAGYYSYKWAEVLSSDAYSLFEENGVFDRETGERFLHAVLEKGGSRPAMESFIDFRGRAPSIDALLRHSGLN